MATVAIRLINSPPPRDDYLATFILQRRPLFNDYYALYVDGPYHIEVSWVWQTGLPTGFVNANWSLPDGTENGAWSVEPVTDNPFLRYSSSEFNPSFFEWRASILITA